MVKYFTNSSKQMKEQTEYSCKETIIAETKETVESHDHLHFKRDMAHQEREREGGRECHKKLLLIIRLGLFSYQMNLIINQSQY